MAIFSNSIIPAAAAAAAAGDVVTKSLRFNDGDTPSLSRTYTSSATWTFSVWVKRGELGATNNLLGTVVQFNASDQLVTPSLTTTAVYRDTASWCHICVSNSGLYVNGVQVTGTVSTSALSDAKVGDTFDGYLADVYLIDGTALTPTSFAEEDATTGQWKPKAFVGVYGTNGFRLPFTDSTTSTTFIDSSSNASTITANGDVVNSQTQKKVGDSSIYFDGTTDSLQTPSTNVRFGTGDFTIEFYAYRTGSGASQNVYDHGYVWGSGMVLQYNASNEMVLYMGLWSPPYVAQIVESSASSTNQWYFYQCVRSSGTITLYRDGVSVGTASDSTDITDTDPVAFGDSINHSASYAFNGYLDEIRVSSTARAASSGPTTAFVSDADTELLIHSNYAGGIGGDTSGEGNNFTATNLAASDVVEDTPTDNYCTLSPIDATSAQTFSEGNLKVSYSAGAYTAGGRSTFAIPSTGDWYWEATCTAVAQNYIGILDLSVPIVGTVSNVIYSSSDFYAYLQDGNKYNVPTGASSYGATFTTDDVIGVALSGSGDLTFYKNGTTQGTAFTGLTPENFSPAYIVYSGAGWLFDFGQSGFAHTPPTGFKALSTGNLPTPTIAKPSEHFSTKLYSGTGNTTQNITGVGFQPDLVWIKKRQSGSHYLLDSVRGLNDLHPGSTATESSSSGRFNSFDSDGFQVEHSGGGGGFTNGASQTYAAWNWLAGTSFTAESGVSDSGSKNVDAGFSIVTWTGNDSGGFSPAPQSVSHGLTVTPELIIAKPRTANGMGNGSWVVCTKDLTSGTYLIMNTTAGEASWSDALVSSIGSSSVSFGSDISGNGEDLNADSFGGADTYVGYLFASKAGYSKVGLYNGNSADNFVALDFAPAWILIKSTGNPSSSGHWVIKDNKRSAAYNPADGNLYANETYAEDTTASVDIDLLSNGFNIQGTYAGINATSSSYIFLAMAEKPLKYASAR